MPNTLYVLYTNRQMYHGSDRTDIDIPPELARDELISLKLPYIPKDRYLHAQMFAELHGARPYPLVALHHRDPLYGSSIQIPSFPKKMTGFPVHQGAVILEDEKEPQLMSIDNFVKRALETLNSTKTFATDLIMDCTPDQHYRGVLKLLEEHYDVKELELN